MTNTIQRALIYTRVSTGGQELDGSSLGTQLAACRAYASERGFSIMGEFTDTHTGSEYREREGLTGLRSMVRAGAADVVVCYALDRFSRNQAHVCILDEEMRQFDVLLELVTEDFEDSAVGRFIRSAKAFASEVEREKISERTERGKIARIRSGKILPGPRALYGYRWRDEEKMALDIDPVTGLIVQRIFSEATAGKPLRQIARGLEDDGILTATGKTRWGPETISQMLKHPNYTGDAYSWAWRPANGKPYSVFDKDGAIKLPDGTVPALIERDVWEAAQDQLRRNKRQSRRNNRNPEATLLRAGFVRCGHCGRAMVAKIDGTHRGYAYPGYRCCGRQHQADSCPMPRIVAHKLDTAVWEHVRRILTDPQIVADELERMQQDDSTGRDLSVIDRGLQDLERRKGNLARRISEEERAEIVAPLMTELERLVKQENSLRIEREQAIAQQGIRERALSDLDSLSGWCETIASRIDDLSYDEKRMALTALGVEARVFSSKHDGPRWEISARIPVGGDILSGTSRG
ncbi:hypothetical protein BH23CHL2_BH23CHL2_07770 [soil metagenome]